MWSGLRLGQWNWNSKKGGGRLAPPPLYLVVPPVVAIDEISLGDGPCSNGLFKESAEDEPSTAGGSTVESESELLQIGLEVGCCERPLMRALYPPLEETNDTMHARH